MTGDLKFSIVVPTYNRAGRIERTIQSVYAQSYPHFEMIIIDDGSTDNTSEVIKPLLNDKIKYFRIPNSERGAARNKGIELSGGDYITFLDSDDIFYADYLSNAAESLKKYNFPPFFHLGYEIIDENGNQKQKVDNLQSDDISIFVRGNPLSCLGVFVKKEVTESYKFIENRSLSGSEDWELWIRIAANYGLKTDNRISAALISHDDRSVLKSDEEKLVARKLTSLQYAFNDKIVAQKFGKLRPLIEAHCDSYISLHLALLGRKAEAFRYLLKSIRNNIGIFRERRFYSIIKHLILPH